MAKLVSSSGLKTSGRVEERREVVLDISVTLDQAFQDLTDATIVLQVNGQTVKRMMAHQAVRMGIITDGAVTSPW